MRFTFTLLGLLALATNVLAAPQETAEQLCRVTNIYI